MDEWIWAGLVAAPFAAFGAWRARSWLQWRWLRTRLIRDVRKSGRPGLEAAWRSGSLSRIEGYWINIERNVVVRRQLARSIAIEPKSLGWKREDPPWTWWWIDADLSCDRQFSCFVQLRDPGHYAHPKQRDVATGDDAFDAGYHVYTYEHDDAPAHQRNVETIASLMQSAAVRETAAAFLSADTDSCSLHSRGMNISTRRTGLLLDDALEQIEKTERLAAAVEAAFRGTPYR